MVEIKRAYEPASRRDGTRVLVDRLWPRGLKKDEAHVVEWLKDLGPSDGLRQFFGHDPGRWDEFRKRYRSELGRVQARRLLHELAEIAERGKLTLVYSAKDTEHNQAVVLKSVLDSMLSHHTRVQV